MRAHGYLEDEYLLLLYPPLSCWEQHRFVGQTRLVPSCSMKRFDQPLSAALAKKNAMTEISALVAAFVGVFLDISPQLALGSGQNAEVSFRSSVGSLEDLYIRSKRIAALIS